MPSLEEVVFDCFNMYFEEISLCWNRIKVVLHYIDKLITSAPPFAHLV